MATKKPNDEGETGDTAAPVAQPNPPGPPAVPARYQKRFAELVREKQIAGLPREDAEAVALRQIEEDSKLAKK